MQKFLLPHVALMMGLTALPMQSNASVGRSPVVPASDYEGIVARDTIPQCILRPDGTFMTDANLNLSDGSKFLIHTDGVSGNFTGYAVLDFLTRPRMIKTMVSDDVGGDERDVVTLVAGIGAKDQRECAITAERMGVVKTRPVPTKITTSGLGLH